MAGGAGSGGTGTKLPYGDPPFSGGARTLPPGDDFGAPRPPSSTMPVGTRLQSLGLGRSTGLSTPSPMGGLLGAPSGGAGGGMGGGRGAAAGLTPWQAQNRQFSGYLDHMMKGMTPQAAQGPQMLRNGTMRPGTVGAPTGPQYGMGLGQANAFFGNTPWGAGIGAMAAKPTTFGNGEMDAWRQQYQGWLGQQGQAFNNYQAQNPAWGQNIYDWWSANNPGRGR